ncbi:hypothetical protein GCM10017566_66730 [Amycolatopsis bartoniae]|uniref:Uncharacterized protein n=2 Tax=Amycolatopsis bartoniae TaxID=941986 RepID=A0A8H9IZU7_9PSEU|nr:hypothetical protein GCM10017566_66730 [Amycolatopsis bartoniae]
MALTVGFLGAARAPQAAATGAGSAYVPVTPARLLDTRTAGPGGSDLPLGEGATLSLQVAGRDGLPSDPSQLTSVVLNVTIVNPTASSFLTLYPDGSTRPITTNLNFTAGQTTANMAIVPVSTANGTVAVYNKNGTTDLLVDVAGYYTPAAAGASTYDTVASTRILDTRNGTGETNGTPAPVGVGATLPVTVEGVAGVPTTGVTAVVLNLTSAGSTLGSFLTAYPDGTTRPSTSSLDFAAGETAANLVIVPLPANTTQIDIYNRNGTTDVVADLFGYYTSGTGATFVPVSPTRMLDTRTAGTGGIDAPLSANTPLKLQITGVDGVPADSSSVTVTAVVLHLTVVNPTDASFLTAYPDGTGRPITSNLNFSSGQLISNLVIASVGPDGAVDVVNKFGTTDLVVDISGYYSS